MKKLIFTLTKITSPWKISQSKAIYTAIRVNVTCEGAVWREGQETTLAHVPTEIFAYMKSGDEYVFDHVCGAMDLVDIKTEEGGLWCRKNYVDIIFPSIEIASDAQDEIESDVRFLAREIESYTDIVGSKTKEIKDGYDN